MNTTVVAALSATTSTQPTTIRHTLGRCGASGGGSHGGSWPGRYGLKDGRLGGAAVPLTTRPEAPPKLHERLKYEPCDKRALTAFAPNITRPPSLATAALPRRC